MIICNIISYILSQKILSAEGTTQGDNLASFHSLSTAPIQSRLRKISVRQVCLADDATGGGNLSELKEWWDTIIENGSKISYYVNESKSWLILKNPEKFNEAKVLLGNTGIKFKTEGKRHIGAALGNDTFRSEYANRKVKTWCDEIEKLCVYAKSQPKAAYGAFIHGEKHKSRYLMRTTQGMSQFMQPLDNLIKNLSIHCSIPL